MNHAHNHDIDCPCFVCQKIRGRHPVRVAIEMITMGFPLPAIQIETGLDRELVSRILNLVMRYWYSHGRATPKELACALTPQISKFRRRRQEKRTSV